MSVALNSFETQWRGRMPDALQPIREQAMQRFLKLGLPSQRDETWRYTDLRSLAARSFAAASCGQDGSLEISEALSLVAAEQQAITVTMMNGCPVNLQEIRGIDGLSINSLQDIIKSDSRSISRFFESATDADQRRWTLLNTALFVDGLYLKVTGIVARPIVVLHVSNG